MFNVGDKVEKIGGEYGGPGVVVGRFEIMPGVWRFNVAHRIAGGYGFLIHIYNERQLRLIGSGDLPPLDEAYRAGLPAQLRNIRDQLRTGYCGQREAWEHELEAAATALEAAVAL